MEGKKVLWVVFSIALALVVILAAGLFLLRPRQPQGGAQAAVPSLEGYDPYEYVRGTSIPPGLSPPPLESEPTVIVVGEPPGAGQAPEAAPALPVQPPAVAPGVAATPDQALAPPERIAAAEAVSAGPPAVPQGRSVASQERAPAAAPPERARTAAPRERAPSARPPERVRSAPKAVRVTEYWIQAGSFSSASRAEQVSRRLEERGLAPRTTTRDLNGKTHFRVRVGPYASKAEAEKFLDWIRELKGFETSYISMVTGRRSMP